VDRNGSEKAPAVLARTTQGAEARDWSWVEDTVWTERMVSALVNGVKGGMAFGRDGAAWVRYAKWLS